MTKTTVLHYDDIVRAFAGSGLIVRGGFHPSQEDNVPDHPDWGEAGTVIMLGNGGSSDLWPVFSAAKTNDPEPLDHWTRQVVEPLAANLGAMALYPFIGPPYLAFQQWAQRAEPLFPSPLRTLIHPKYGLWHAYRAALAFPEMVHLPEPVVQPSPCDDCNEKPCLDACPEEAFTTEGFAIDACVRHLDLADSHCMGAGCLARLACPVGTEFTYSPEQMRFHMAAFHRLLRC